MLKIKDNVDLKELEEFGFRDGLFAFVNKTLVVDKGNKSIIIVLGGEADCVSKATDILFDLIQAGLVEKVVEDE